MKTTYNLYVYIIYMYSYYANTSAVSKHSTGEDTFLNVVVSIDQRCIILEEIKKRKGAQRSQSHWPSEERSSTEYE